MEQAVEWDLVPKNPAKGRNRLLREERPTRTFLQPPQVVALLDAAGSLDTQARKGDTRRRRALLAVLTLGGLRIGEALDLRWRDVNLAGQRLRVTASKTAAGIRDVVLSPALLEALTEYRAQTRHHEPDDLIFGTAAGKRDSDSNVRTRYLAPAVERANGGLEAEGSEAIGKVTPHSLRRTFISLLAFAGVDLKRIMAEVGHTDPKMTLGVYAGLVAFEADDFERILGDLVGRGLEFSGPKIAQEVAQASKAR
jgi:integrase